MSHPTVPETPPEELRVSSSAEIAAYLHELHREQAQVLLSSPGGHALTSRIGTFNPSANLLGFEVGVDPQGASQHLVASSEITAVAYLGAIKLQFELEAPLLVSDAHGAVLRCALPERLYRFQRRQAFRVQPAGALFPRVMLPQPDGSHRPLRVLDLSVGGLAFELPVDAPAVHPGDLFPSLSLELDRSTRLNVGLRLQHVSDWRADGRQTWHVGGSFTPLDTAVLRSLQVYVDQTQKRRRLLKLDA